MKKIYYLFMSMTVILLAACSQDEMEQVKEGTLPELRVMVNHPSSISTRATVNDVATTFQDGDKIGVFVLDPDGDPMNINVAYEYNGTSWTLVDQTKKVYYSPNCSYYAYYPYVEKEEGKWSYLLSFYMGALTPTEFFSGFVSSWEPLLDQSTLANFNASDLMIGKGIDNSETASVSFTLGHQMGLIRLSYKDWETDECYEDVSFMDNSYFYNEEDENEIYPLPYNTGKYLYYIAKPGTTFEFWCWGSAFGYQQYSVDVDESEGFITDFTIEPSS